MRDTHVLCNHYQLRYSTIIYYTSKRYSSCQCTLCARCRCSDDIDFASPCLPLPSLAGSRDLFVAFSFLFSPVSVPELGCPRDAISNGNDGSPLRKVRSHRDDVVRTTCSSARFRRLPRWRSRIIATQRDVIPRSRQIGTTAVTTALFPVVERISKDFRNKAGS